ncbi:TPA: hypothetical protein KIA93_000337 [Salmonella enterica]|uniref:DUF7168 domain-containing protein n=1 Tax=Salmonella enterica TaxID=28901 RepID=UPI0009AFA8B3|nr:hypothetical protein [Salmonella enterica]HBD1844131.1 hypothetical protein [Salmonella enterica]
MFTTQIEYRLKTLREAWHPEAAEQLLRDIQQQLHSEEYKAPHWHLSDIYETQVLTACKSNGWFNALTALVCMATGCRSRYCRSLNHDKRLVLFFYGIGDRPSIASLLFYNLYYALMRCARRSPELRNAVSLVNRRKQLDFFRMGWISRLWLALDSHTLTAGEQQLLAQWWKVSGGQDVCRT